MKRLLQRVVARIPRLFNAHWAANARW